MYSLFEKENVKTVFWGISVQLYATKEEKQYIVLTHGMETRSEQNYLYVFHNINQELAIEYAYQMAANILEEGQILEAFEDFDKYIVNPKSPYRANEDALIRIFSF